MIEYRPSWRRRPSRLGRAADRGAARLGGRSPGLVELKVLLMQVIEFSIGVEQSDRCPIDVNQVHAAPRTYQLGEAVDELLLVRSIVAST